MNEDVLIAVIGGISVILAGIIGVLPLIKRNKRKENSSSFNQDNSYKQSNLQSRSIRRVYYKSKEFRFLNFGPKNSRIQEIEGGESFLVSTSHLSHDKEGKVPVTRDSIVMRS